MLPDQSVAVVGEVVPGAGHFQKLVALRAFRDLLGENAALFGVLAVFGCFLHGFPP